MIGLRNKKFLSKINIETDYITYYIIKSIDCYCLAKHDIFKQKEYMLLSYGWFDLDCITSFITAMRLAKHFKTFNDARLYIDFDMI